MSPSRTRIARSEQSKLQNSMFGRMKNFMIFTM